MFERNRDVPFRNLSLEIVGQLLNLGFILIGELCGGHLDGFECRRSQLLDEIGREMPVHLGHEPTVERVRERFRIRAGDAEFEVDKLLLAPGDNRT